VKVKCKVDTCFAAGRANSVEWPWHYRHCQDRQRQDGGVSVANDHTHHGSATAPAWWRTDRSHLCSNQGTLTTGSFVRSFVLSSGVARPLAVYATCFQPPPALRPRLAQCATPLTLGLVLYILRAQLSLRVSLARWQWCGPVRQVEPQTPPICYPHQRLLLCPDAANPGVMTCHIWKRTQANPLVSTREFNLIACRNLTRQAGMLKILNVCHNCGMSSLIWLGYIKDHYYYYYCKCVCLFTEQCFQTELSECWIVVFHVTATVLGIDWTSLLPCWH